jgi:4-amino-4-deoxy-L-arabinose transferase-like glycosyltransferase
MSEPRVASLDRGPGTAKHLSRHWGVAAALLGAHLVLALLYSVVVPLGEAPDEIDHYAFVRHIMVERRLPQGPAVTQGKHPPLYYLLSAVMASQIEPTFDFVRANPDFSLTSEESSPNLLIHTSLESYPYRAGPLVMHLIRAFSALLSTIAVWSVYQLARVAFPREPAAAVGSAAIAAFVPGILFINGSINNDNLAAVSAGLALLVSVQVVREGTALRRVVLLGCLLGLGLLTKVGTLAVWPAAAIAVSYAATSSSDHSVAAADGLAKHRWRRVACNWLVWNGLAFGLAFALAAPWLVRNWRLYGDPLGWSLVRATVDVRTSPLRWEDVLELVPGWFTTFWGRIGGAVHIYLPPAAYIVLGTLTGLAILGLGRRCLRSLFTSPTRDQGQEDRTRGVALLMLGVTLVAALVSVVRYSAVALGTDQARLLLPALTPIAILFWLGLAECVPADRRPLLAAGLAVALAVSGLASLLFVRSVYAPPHPVQTTRLATISTSSAGVFGERLALVGHEPDTLRGTAGQPLRFTLYWQAEADLESDLRAEVWVLSPGGGLVASWKRSPLAGRLSTDLWPTQQVYADEYSMPLPDWLSPGEYTLTVGVREFPSEEWLPSDGQQDRSQRSIAKVVIGD